MALMVWFYEHTHGNVPTFVYDPSFKLINKEAFPHVLKWGTRNYKHEETYKSLLNVNGLFQSLSCLQPVSNEEASYISPLEEGSTSEVRASTPVREASTPVTEASTPETEASNPIFGETNTLAEETSPFGDFMKLTGGCTSPLTRVNHNNNSNELVALKELIKDLQEQLAAKERENQQLREQVGHLEELLSVREGCGVGQDTTVHFEDPISEMGPEPHVKYKNALKSPVRLNGAATFIGIVRLLVVVFILVVLLIRYFTSHTKNTEGFVRVKAGKTSFSTTVGVIKIVTISITIVVVVVPQVTLNQLEIGTYLVTSSHPPSVVLNMVVIALFWGLEYYPVPLL
ncbi:hypothetical protein H6P81_006075 [Aristolochia fimbriata]|uniref:Uncharacterized protein n=1 Tax=Aristolochia fimbriata TaxID=158543 RepID=A0AAV7EXH0_ARIFI|nr:hypothetical protein H6P81_006075 [Aristolochia fimbriata]